MDELGKALRAGLGGSAPGGVAGDMLGDLVAHHPLDTAGRVNSAGVVGDQRRLVVIGGGGPLGAAVLERLLASGAWHRVAAVVSQPVAVALQGFEAWPSTPMLDAPPTAQQRAATAVLVFDRERQANGREAAFVRPQPGHLAATGRWLLQAGVRRLVVVLPHAPALLPQAVRAGLASLDEQALAALGFEHLVLVRPAHGVGTQAPPAGGRWGDRVARLVLGQLAWMVPQREQALRVGKVADFVTALSRALPGTPHGTRVAPPELLWDWAQPGGGEALLQAWLQGRTLPAVQQSGRRW